MEEDRHPEEVSKPEVPNQQAYQYPSLWTCMKSSLLYTVLLFKKFFRSIFIGLAFTSLIDFVFWTAITAKKITKKNGGVDGA